MALDSAALAPPWCPGSNPSSATSQLLRLQKSPGQREQNPHPRCNKIPSAAARNHRVLLSRFWGQTSQLKMSQGRAPSRGSRESPSRGFRVPWLVATSVRRPPPLTAASPCVSAHRTSSSLCVCLHRRESSRTSAVWVFWCFPHDRTEGCALLILLSHCSSQLTSSPSPGGDAGQVPALGSPRPPSPQHTDTLKGALARPLGAILGASAGEAFFLSRCLCSVPYISVEV